MTTRAERLSQQSQTAPFACTCGRTTRDTPPRSGADHCRFCLTRPSPALGLTIGRDEGHRYWDAGYGPDGEPILRCIDCDGRPHSHRRYPGDDDYEFIIQRADDRAARPGKTRGG